MRVRVAQLDRGGYDFRTLDGEVFLACEHRAGDAGGVYFVVHLKCQQTQRAEIGARRPFLEILNGVVGLAAVRRADVQDELPVQASCPLYIGLGRVLRKQGGDFAALLQLQKLFSALLNCLLHLGEEQRRLHGGLAPYLLRP